MTFLGLFGGSKELDHEEFERQLSALSRDIAKLRNQITFLHRKRASVRLLAIMYLTAIYLAIVAYRYRGATSGLGMVANGKSIWQKFMMLLLSKDMAIVLLAPLLIALLVYSLDTLFKWWIHAKEKSLKHLMKRHREKLEELKLKTNFSKTNQLLQRFDSSSPLNTPGPTPRSAQDKLQPRKLQPLPNTINRPNDTTNVSEKGASNGNGKPTFLTPVGPGSPAKSNFSEKVNKLQGMPENGNSGVTFGAPSSGMSSTSPPAGSGWTGQSKKGFHDRILDLIIGSEHNETVESRYALICARCYTHNGLAPPGCTDPFSIVYFCRNCSFMNGKVEDRGHKVGESSSEVSLASDDKSKHIEQYAVINNGSEMDASSEAKSEINVDSKKADDGEER